MTFSVMTYVGLEHYYVAQEGLAYLPLCVTYKRLVHLSLCGTQEGLAHLSLCVTYKRPVQLSLHVTQERLAHLPLRVSHEPR